MLFASNCFLTGAAYRGILTLQCAWYLLACTRAAFPYTFVVMNWAAVVGLYHFLRGQHDVWSGYESAVALPKVTQLHEPADRRDAALSRVA
jgi:hypothetical protein